MNFVMLARCTAMGCRIAVILLLACCSRAGAMEAVQLSPDGKSFMLATSGKRFVPWGFNYDHDEKGRLLEDYWLTEWSKVEEDLPARAAFLKSKTSRSLVSNSRCLI